MAKKGPIGKAEAFYIENHYPQTEAKQLAEDLDRTITSIKSFIKKNKLDQKATMTVDDQLAKQKGSVVMTENASSMIDARKKSQTSRPESCVTTIRI